MEAVDDDPDSRRRGGSRGLLAAHASFPALSWCQLGLPRAPSTRRRPVPWRRRPSTQPSSSVSHHGLLMVGGGQRKEAEGSVLRATWRFTRRFVAVDFFLVVSLIFYSITDRD